MGNFFSAPKLVAPVPDKYVLPHQQDHPILSFFENLFKAPSQTFAQTPTMPETPLPGQEAWAEKMSKTNGSLTKKQYEDLYRKAASNPGFTGYYGAQSPTPAVLSASTSQPSNMPTPTPADTQFPTKLAQLPNDPGSTFNPIIERAAAQYGVPAALLKGVLSHESKQFNTDVVYGKVMHDDGHGMGVAGIDNRAHPEITPQQAFDPNFAIPYSASLLAGYHQQQGDWGKALRYYNGGGNYDSQQPGYAGVPIKQRTMNYLDNVYKQALQYGQNQ